MVVPLLTQHLPTMNCGAGALSCRCRLHAHGLECAAHWARWSVQKLRRLVYRVPNQRHAAVQEAQRRQHRRRGGADRTAERFGLEKT
eukprot:scaffold212596_cov30-Tisochrysis_lutea.AAC.3